MPMYAIIYIVISYISCTLPVHASAVILLLSPLNCITSNPLMRFTFSGEPAMPKSSLILRLFPTPTAYTVTPSFLRALAAGMV